MKSIREIMIQGPPRSQAFLVLLRVVSLVAALTLLFALPVQAVSWYSGASVGSDGTVYGWGVTDVSSVTMVHQAYVSTALTSPKGRKASLPMGNAPNYCREDVQLPFDSTD